MSRLFSGMNLPVMFGVDVWQTIRSGKNRTEARPEQPCKIEGAPHNKFINMKSTAVVKTSYVCVNKYDVRPLRCQPHSMPLAFASRHPLVDADDRKNPETLEDLSKDLLVQTSSSIVAENTQLSVCIPQPPTSDLSASSGELAPASLVDEHEEDLCDLPLNASVLNFSPSNTTLVQASPEAPDKLASSSAVHSTPFLAFLEASHLEQSKRFREDKVELSTGDLGCAQFNSAYYRRFPPPSLTLFKSTNKSSKSLCWKTRIDEIMKDEECTDMSNENSEDTTIEHSRSSSGSSLSSSHLRLCSLSSDNTCVETPELLAGSFLDEQKEILLEQDPLFSSTETTPTISLKNIQSNPAFAPPSLPSTSSPLKSQIYFDPKVFQSLCEEKSKPNLPRIQGGIALGEAFEAQIVATSDIFESFSSPHLCSVGSLSDRKCVDTPNPIFVQRSCFTIVSRASFVLFFSIILHFSFEVFLCNLRSVQ